MGPFTLYKPADGLDFALYLQDSQQQDWYQAQKQFSPETSTLKFTCDERRILRSASADVSALFPCGMSVHEVPLNTLPSGVLPENAGNGEWMFDGKAIIPRIYNREELREQAESEKSALLHLAAQAMAPLADAADLGIATAEETARLTEWKKYRVALSRMDTTADGETEWPEGPE